VFGRLAGYEDVNDADRLGREPAMRWIVGWRAVTEQAAATSQMGHFETSAMTTPTNLTALADLSGRWIDRVQARRAATALVLDIASGGSPTYGAQEGTAYNGHFERTCYQPLFVFNQDGDLERCALRPGRRYAARAVRTPPRSNREAATAGPGPMLTLHGRGAGIGDRGAPGVRPWGAHVSRKVLREAPEGRRASRGRLPSRRGKTVCL